MLIKKAWGELSPIQKADLAISDLQSDGGYLPAAHAIKFVEILIQEANFLPLCTVHSLKNPQMEIPATNFASSILKPGVSGTRQEAADRSKPSFTDITLTPKLFRGTVKIDDETLEDNIERAAFMSTILGLIGRRIAVDVDEIILNGDTALPSGMLSVIDGVRKQITANIVDAAGGQMTPTLLSSAYKSMPKGYKKPQSRMRWLTSCNAVEDFRTAYAARATALGDQSLQNAAMLTNNGIKVVDLGAMPEDLGGGSDQTEIILSHPKENFHVGFSRMIRFEQERVAREGATYVVVSLRLDVGVLLQEAAVKITNVLNS